MFTSAQGIHLRATVICVVVFEVIETGSHDVAQAGPELVVNAVASAS